MGIEDRDWYWKSRAARKSADDSYFLRPKASARSPRLAAGVVGFALALALFFFAVRQGWFEQEPQPARGAVARKLEALRKWEEQGSPGRPAPIVHPRHAEPPATTVPARPERRASPLRIAPAERSEGRRGLESAVESALVVLAVASPFTFFALIVALFFRRARPAAGWGFVGGVVGFVFAFLGLWSWIRKAVDMAGAGQFIAHAAGSFTLGALVAIVLVEAIRIANARRALQFEGELEAPPAAATTGRTRK